jgi:hypothetical protein
MCFACTLYSLLLILCIPAYLGIKGDQFFSDEDFFLAVILRKNLLYYNLYQGSDFMQNLM